MPAPDPDFTRYAATGDETAFRALVAAHLGMVLGVAARKLGPHAHLAPDVAQAAFTRLARVARGLPRDLIVAPWLHRQAVRLACDAVRKEERRLRRETTAAMLHAPDSTPPPAETALLLDEALDQLPAADRTVLVLRYLEDRDFESVAQSLGSTPEAARKRIARSLEKLRALLTRRGVALTAAGLSAFLSTQSTQAAATAALSARISASALKSAAATGNTAAILTTALMSHATALTTGALAALLACGLFYQQREKEIAQSALTAQPAPSAVSFGSDRSALSDQSGPASAPLPSTLPEIIAAIATLTDGPDTRAAQQRITALLRRVSPEQYLEFYTTAEPRIHPLRWQALVDQSLAEWRQRDPAALVQALVASNNAKRSAVSEGGMSGNAVLNGIEFSSDREGGHTMDTRIFDLFNEWLKLDRAAATAWLEKVRDTPFLRMPCMMEGTICDYFAAKAVASASGGQNLETVRAAHPRRPRRTDIETAWADGRLASAGTLEAAMRSAGGREEAAVIAQRYAEAHADECRRLAEQITEEPLKFAAALGLVAQYQIDFEDGCRTLNPPERLERAEFALKNRGTAPLSEALEEVTAAWLRSITDSDAAFREWVVKQGGAESGPALAAGARRLSEFGYSTPDALQWAAAVPDAAQRGPLLRGIYLRWQDADPAAAQKFLTTAPADIAAELRSLTPEAP